jgi:hypothetical protein
MAASLGEAMGIEAEPVIGQHTVGGLALLLAMSHVGVSQDDHAPSVETCRADKNLWADQITEYEYAEADYITKGLPNRTFIIGLTYNQLNIRPREMGQCAVVDTPMEAAYNQLLSRYSNARDDRFKFFVERHNLKKQMIAEDAAGKRH